jgi:hypothetical protein
MGIAQHYLKTHCDTWMTAVAVAAAPLTQGHSRFITPLQAVGNVG